MPIESDARGLGNKGLERAQLLVAVTWRNLKEGQRRATWWNRLRPASGRGSQSATSAYLAGCRENGCLGTYVPNQETLTALHTINVQQLRILKSSRSLTGRTRSIGGCL